MSYQTLIKRFKQIIEEVRALKFLLHNGPTLLTEIDNKFQIQRRSLYRDIESKEKQEYLSKVQSNRPRKTHLRANGKSQALLDEFNTILRETYKEFNPDLTCFSEDELNVLLSLFYKKILYEVRNFTNKTTNLSDLKEYLEKYYIDPPNGKITEFLKKYQKKRK